MYKLGYQKHCLKPVLIRDVPEKGCAYRLFEALDRRFGMQYKSQHVIQQANIFFFEEVERQIVRDFKKNPKDARKAQKIFSGKRSMLLYYQKIYSFK